MRLLEAHEPGFGKMFECYLRAKGRTGFGPALPTAPSKRGAKSGMAMAGILAEQLAGHTWEPGGAGAKCSH